MGKDSLLVLGVALGVATTMYCRRISKQLDKLTKEDNGTYKYIDGDGNEIEVGTNYHTSDKNRGFYF